MQFAIDGLVFALGWHQTQSVGGRQVPDRKPQGNADGTTIGNSDRVGVKIIRRQTQDRRVIGLDNRRLVFPLAGGRKNRLQIHGEVEAGGQLISHYLPQVVRHPEIAHHGKSLRIKWPPPFIPHNRPG